MSPDFPRSCATQLFGPVPMQTDSNVCAWYVIRLIEISRGRGGCRVEVSEVEVLRGIFGPTREEEIG